MNVLVYVALCLPAILMVVAGLLISSVKKDSTMTSHHFAKRYNIKDFSKRVIKLFTVTGIVFSLGGLLIVLDKLVFGLIILFVALLVFFIRFASVYRNS